ncbi:selenium metabolism hydrolase [Anaerolineaceae bacterium oral taxon 439]|nr:selenium metabolism hydrolase [Anaerolineaceae bacterium oral taxon 439]
MDFKAIRAKAESYADDMTKFMCDLIAIPGESCQEGPTVQRIKQEMEKVGFDKVEIDPMGNIFGWIGHGSHLIAMDGHIDNVGVGDINNWTVTGPFEPKVIGDEIYGRGGSDQEGGMVSMVYAGKIIKDLHLEDDYTLLVVGSVQEEDCDGLCWQYIVNEDKIRPEFVLITEPTSLRIYRGHRGRMEIKVRTPGISCHGSAPERGDNAIYKMAPIINEIRALNENLHYDPFLGKGTVTISEIFFTSPSRCAVADSCTISLDRRLTDGETWESALQEIRNLPSVKEAKAEVSMYTYERPSYTNLTYPTECFFPTWVIPEDHVATQTLASAYENLFDKKPVIDKWTFSTNGVSIMGRYGIPCIGFGPGAEDQAHAPNEKTWTSHLVTAAAMYAAVPAVYCGKLKK